MKELWLNFKDEQGKPKRVLVEGEKFAIGRTPDNDLPIPLGNLSRQHAKIERFADVYIVSDCGSSNGSTLNGEPLEDPAALKNDDILNLGGALEITIEVPSEKGKGKGEDVSPAPKFDDDDDETSASSPVGAAVSAKSASASDSSSGGGSGSGSFWLLLLAPIFMVLVLLGLGGTILVVRSANQSSTDDGNFVVSNEDKEDKEDFPSGNDKTPEKETPTPTATPGTTPGGTSTPVSSTPTGSNSSPNNSSTSEPSSTPTKVSGEAEKIKIASALFLRRIATDQKAFLLEEQVLVVSAKVNQFKGSGALAENIRNAKKNASQITTMAQSRNLKPQFLAAAALAQLGNQKGDVVATASGMLENLATIVRDFGNDSADDSLLIIAAYSNNTSGSALQSVAGTSTTKDNNDAQSVRSIWFFKKHGKLTNEQFDFALKFLAIGTITQNPKDFNVSAEALVL